MWLVSPDKCHSIEITHVSLQGTSIYAYKRERPILMHKYDTKDRAEQMFEVILHAISEGINLLFMEE